MAAARTALAVADQPRVVVADGAAHFYGFVETEPAVVEHLTAAADPEVSAHRLLILGGRAAGYVAATTQTEQFQHRLEVMTAAVEATVAGSMTQLHEATAALVDGDDGELAQLLTRFMGEIGGMLDPARRDSAASELTAALRTVMEKVLEAHTRVVRRLVDPHTEDSPLGQVVHLVRDHTAVLTAEVRRLGDVVAGDRARSEGLDRSSLKGLPYEEMVFHAVAGVAATTGDAAEHVGRDRGVAGTLKGDIVVHLDPSDTCGRAVCYAVEAKSGRSRMRAALEELDQVMANRDALAAIAVYGDADLAPCPVPFQPYDNRALVVFDRSELDDRALRLACLWARWVVRRQLGDHSPGLDVDRMVAAVDRAARALARAATIRRALTGAARSVGDARTQVDELVAEVDAAMRTMTEELGG